MKPAAATTEAPITVALVRGQTSAEPSPIAAAFSTPVRASPTASAERLPQDGRVFLAYYVPYDPTSWSSLEAHADQIDILVTQTVFANACGGLTTVDDRTLQAFARSRGLEVLPSLFVIDPTTIHRLLADPSVSARFVTTLADYVAAEGYAGLDVDLENVPSADRSALTAFVRHLGVALHARGKLLTMAVPAKLRDTTTGLSGAFDYAALASSVDLVTVMTYGYSWAGGPPGAIAPDDWVNRVIAYATSQFPPRKVLVGIPFYGYDWNVTTGGRARALDYTQAEALARQYRVSIGLDPLTRSATFQYLAGPSDSPPPVPRHPALKHDIRVQRPPPCAVPSATPRPATPTPVPYAGHHVVWLEDVASFAPRLALASQHHAGGVAVWRLGQEDPRVWQVVAAWRRGTSP